MGTGTFNDKLFDWHPSHFDYGSIQRRERALRDLVRKRQKPIALFIDDAHDLHSKSLIGLKRLIEVVRDSGTLSVLLAGHPDPRGILQGRPETGRRGHDRKCARQGVLTGSNQG